MTFTALTSFYADYLDCLNRRDWPRLQDFVAEDAVHNGNRFGLEGYRRMLERDVAAIPDLRFSPEIVVANPPHIAARLVFDCTPVGMLFGIDTGGRRVRFCENVFYRIEAGRIREVYSLIDTGAISAALSPPAAP